MCVCVCTFVVGHYLELPHLSVPTTLPSIPIYSSLNIPHYDCQSLEPLLWILNCSAMFSIYVSIAWLHVTL